MVWSISIHLLVYSDQDRSPNLTDRSRGRSGEMNEYIRWTGDIHEPNHSELNFLRMYFIRSLICENTISFSEEEIYM